jgi:hypothetical protein
MKFDIENAIAILKKIRERCTCLLEKWAIDEAIRKLQKS